MELLNFESFEIQSKFNRIKLLSCIIALKNLRIQIVAPIRSYLIIIILFNYSYEFWIIVDFYFDQRMFLLLSYTINYLYTIIYNN